MREEIVVKMIQRLLAVCLALTVFIGMSPMVSASTSRGFDDVHREHWFYHAVWSAQFRRITNGISTDPPLFAPNRAVTRAEFITMLGRTHETEEFIGRTVTYDKSQNPYTDIVLTSFYTPYVLWATAYGIVQGDGHGNFRPNAPITREEMAVVIFNYINAFEFHDYFEDRGTLQYVDQDSIATWGVEAVEWLSRHRIIRGSEVSDNLRSFRPMAHLTRAEAVTLLVRVSDAMGPQFTPTLD